MKVINQFFDNCIEIQFATAADARGEMLRSFNAKEIGEIIPDFKIYDERIAYIQKHGTFTGMYTNLPGNEMGTLITILSGDEWVYVTDLREGSETYGYVKIVMMADTTPQAVYIPEGFGYGLLSVKDNTTILIATSGPMNCIKHFNYKDPTLHVNLPNDELIISQEDLNAPNL